MFFILILVLGVFGQYPFWSMLTTGQYVSTPSIDAGLLMALSVAAIGTLVVWYDLVHLSRRVAQLEEQQAANQQKSITAESPVLDEMTKRGLL